MKRWYRLPGGKMTNSSQEYGNAGYKLIFVWS